MRRGEARTSVARKDFLRWQTAPILVLLVMILGLAGLAAFVSKPWSIGDALIFIFFLGIATRLLIRLLDRFDIVRSLSSIWTALDNQDRDSPPTADLLSGLDWLRGSLITYVRSSLGHYSGSDLHIPRLRRDMDLSFGHVTELLHRSAWIPSPIFKGNLKYGVNPSLSGAAYDFLFGWVNEISKHILATRRRSRLFENRILALSYFFHDSVSFFEQVHPLIAKEVSELVTEKTVKAQTRRLAVSATLKDVGLPILAIVGALGGIILQWGLKL